MKLKALCLGMGLLCSLSSLAATELRYGVEAEYPPFESRNAAGELEGFDVELGNAICKAAPLKCSWVETSFDALIPGLVAKKFDAINSAMNITEQRRKSIDFTQPIYRIPSQLVGKSGDGGGGHRGRAERENHRRVAGFHPGNLRQRALGKAGCHGGVV